MSLSKEISDITECSICAESFVDPRVLPCVHTFCLKCLESYGKSRQSGENLNCPICRAKFDLPSTKFTDLPVNFFIQKLLEINKISEGETTNACDACSDQTDSSRRASVYCFDCRQSLCDQCFQVHNNLKCVRSHQVAEFGKKQAEELLKVSPTFCEAHPDEIVKFYCSDCEATICMSCYVEEHNSHKCSNILKVSDGFLQQLKDDTSKVSEHITTCFSEEEKLKKKKTEFLQDIKKKESQISETVKELHELVDIYGKKIMAEVKSIKEAKLKEFEVTENEIHDHLMMMESFKRYSEEVMMKATPSDITRLSNMLRKRAAELHAIRLDNDLQVFDVEIISSNSNLKSILANRVDNPACDYMVYNSRKEYGKAFISPYTLVSIPVAEKKAITEMATIGQELYLINRGAQTISDSKICIGSEIAKLLLPSSYQYHQNVEQGGFLFHQSQQSTYYVANYTKCDSVIFHLQLWMCKSSAGETLQLQVSNLSLAENDGNAETFVTFNLPPQETRQPSNISEHFLLKSPQKLIAGCAYGIYFNPQLSSTASILRVQPSVLFYTDGHVNQAEALINIPFKAPTVIDLPSNLLEVYDTQPEKMEDIPTASSKTIGGAIIKLKLPDTFTDKDGNPVQRTSYTQSDSVLLHMQLNDSEKPSGETAALELKISKLSFCDSEGVFVPAATLSIQPYSIKMPSDTNRETTLKATQTLINNGFYGIDLRFQVETTQGSVKVEASIISINTINENYPTEKVICIPTSTRKASLILRRTINLPSAIDPSGMVSCNYFHCIYIGDRQSSSIYRIEPIGRIKKWQVTEVPDGLSVTPNHTLIVTFGKSSTINEFNTHGVLLRDIKLTGLSNPLHSVVVADCCFLVVTGSGPIYLASVAESTLPKKPRRKSFREEVCVKEMILYSNSDTKLVPIASCSQSLEGESTVVAKKKGRRRVLLESVELVPAALRAESLEGNAATEESSVLSEGQSIEITDWNEVQLNGPVHMVVDRFGFVFILTTNDAKVHLLSPQLNYVHELISLDKHGMENPSRIHFNNESGILYVQSKDGPQSLLGFQVTEGKVDPSVWKKDI